LIPGGLIFSALLLTGGLPGQGVPEERRIIQSADGQVATLVYQAGFLGRDQTEVRLKRAGCCRQITVFWHAGSSALDDPKVDWQDTHHLRILYHARASDGDECVSHLADIAIVCKAESWMGSRRYLGCPRRRSRCRRANTDLIGSIRTRELSA
jgi:hypothetical protein